MPIIKKVVFSPLLISTFLFLFFQLQVFNLGISYRDEGFLLNNAWQINQGKLPYRDFFLTTTPGTFYLQAFLMKIFGNYLIIDRLLYGALVILLLFLVSKIFKLRPPFDFLYLITLAFFISKLKSNGSAG
jgi:hypothetical protein